LSTDEQCQVLDAHKKTIEGLYAVGNDAASIMGGNYPGAGITLGPAVTLGYVAAHALLRQQAEFSNALLRPNITQRETVLAQRL
jgi:succinate dehydrogenase/fumarate reductase flavoprotein subunit